MNRHWTARHFIAALTGLALVFCLSLAPAWASERALYIHYTHTKETARIVFKRNGQYVQSGLDELNYFLRDWRRNEPTKMDPRLFDLVWEVYQDVAGSQPIHVVSAYRSPATNAMLAKNSSGVADNSQHMRGTAMDFFIPGVPLQKLRAAAMRRQVGGVGYYPSSGSPFVHLDTGSVRAWPRMTKAQLKELFPDGRTMHVPTDGKPLSQEGYQLAMAEWKKCRSVPCNGSPSGTRIASNSAGEAGSGGTLMDMLFGNNKSSKAPAAQPAAPTMQVAALSPQASNQPSAAPTPAQRVAPVPAMRPASLGGIAMAPEAPAAPLAIPFSSVGSAPLDPAELAPRRVAPVPALKSREMEIATSTPRTADSAVTALEALMAPQPRLQMTEPPSETLTAYLPATTPDAGAQRALQMIIEGTTTGSAAPAPQEKRLPPLSASLRTASLGGQAPDQTGGLFEGTFTAAERAGDKDMAEALAAFVATAPASSNGMRRPDFVAPDLEHVEMLTVPVALTSDHFAVIFDHDEADFDPTPEMGKHVRKMGLGDDTTSLHHGHFTMVAPALRS